MKRQLARHARDLPVLWPHLKPMEKALFFKLLSPSGGLALFARLPLEEQVFLLGARDLGSIAPLLEGRPEEIRSLFEPTPEDCYEEMLRLAR